MPNKSRICPDRGSAASNDRNANQPEQWKEAKNDVMKKKLKKKRRNKILIGPLKKPNISKY